MKRLDYFLCILKLDKTGAHFYSPFLTTREEGVDAVRVSYSSSKMRDDIPEGVFLYPTDEFEHCPKSAYCQLTGDIVKGQPMFLTEDQYADDKFWPVPASKPAKTASKSK
jgi:hypothetical protein